MSKVNTRHNHIIVQNDVLMHKIVFSCINTSVHYVQLEISFSAPKHKGSWAYRFSMCVPGFTAPKSKYFLIATLFEQAKLLKLGKLVQNRFMNQRKSV